VPKRRFALRPRSVIPGLGVVLTQVRGGGGRGDDARAPISPLRGESLCALHLDRAGALSVAQARNRIHCESFAVTDCGEFDHGAAAVSADAHDAAESSRDVSEPTCGPPTPTPGSVTGLLTSRLRV
jgi:hypothetical protein